MIEMIKTPAAVLDYGFDWSEWLERGETITSAVWSVDPGITIGAQANEAGITVVWLSGGAANSQYYATCRVTTSGGRTDERSLRIRIVERKMADALH